MISKQNVVKTLLAGIVLCISQLASAAVIKTDVIFIVDESGSMDTVQTNIRNSIATFAQILNDGGVNGLFGLVGYGDSSQAPNTLTNLTSPANFALAADDLVASGGTEPAYDAIAYALNQANDYNSGGNFSFRSDAVPNIILVSDEVHNGSNTLWSSIDTMLTNFGALFNVVSDSSANVERNGGSFATLASNHGGQVFSFSGLNTTDENIITEFVETFAGAKLQETLDFCEANPDAPACNAQDVPEPQGLIALALAFLAIRRTCNKKA